MTDDDLRHLRSRLDHLEDPEQLVAIAHSLLDEIERSRFAAASAPPGSASEFASSPNLD